MVADFTIVPGLLGDGCWPEPALSAAGAADPRGFVNVHVGTEVLRPLYEHNQHINMVNEPCGVILNCSDAFWWSAGRNRYFAEGYFVQCGLMPPKESRDETPEGFPRIPRIHFKLHGFTPTLRDMVVICPFCGASGATGNKTNEADWWNTLLIDHLHTIDAFRNTGVYSLGSESDPAIGGTISKRGIPLRDAAKMIAEARLVITVETFGCVVAGGKEVGKTLVLNAATPPSLHFTKDMESRGSRYIRDPKPENWDVQLIAETVEEMLRP